MTNFPATAWRLLLLLLLLLLLSILIAICLNTIRHYTEAQSHIDSEAEVIYCHQGRQQSTRDSST